MPPSYPTGTVRTLLGTDAVTAPTRAALERRLAQVPDAPRFLDAGAFATLGAVCARLVPQDDFDPPIDLAGEVDRRLAAGEGNGWRYDSLPPDGEACRLGLRGLDETAGTRFEAAFVDLHGAQQDAILADVQRGRVTGGVWAALPAARWFEEVLAEAVEIYQAHPHAQEAIGYVGMADAPGWTRLGLNDLEAREPQPL